LSLGALSTVLITALPDLNPRIFAVPTGIALIGLGYSLWRQATRPNGPTTESMRSRLNPMRTK
jgi:hypothetical protein